MSHLIEKILGRDIQQYISSSKFCKITNESCSIEGKFGSVTLDFSRFSNVNSCQIKLKKTSGNGLITIINQDEVLNINIVSKVSETVTVDLSKNKKIVLHRPASGIGFVDLIGIYLYSDQSRTYTVDNDVRVALNKCKRNFIKVVDTRVFANEGSEIEASTLVDIETEPSNMYKINGGKVTFLGLCEIIRLSVEDYMINESPHFLQPIKNISEMSTKANYLKQIENDIKRSPISFDFKPNIHIDPDSVRDVGVLDNGINVGRYGSFKIPNIKLNPNSRYTLYVSAKNLSGNGQVSFDIPSSTLKNNVLYLTDTIERIQFTTGNETSFNLTGTRGGSSTGDVWISNIYITSNAYIASSPLVLHKPAFNKSISFKDPWKLPFPKIAHFYWGGGLSFLRYASLYSFVKHNPDWKVKLHVPEVLGNFNPAWKTNEQKSNINIGKNFQNYIGSVSGLNIEVVKHNFENYKFKNEEHEVHKSDLLRWILLSTEGGLWSDSDIIYTHPMYMMDENNEKNAGCSTAICKLEGGGHAIGFLLATANNDFYSKVLDMSYKKFNKRAYQSIGADIFNKYLSKLPSDNILLINPETVYSIDDANIGKFLLRDVYIQDYQSAIGFHWYGGSPIISELESQMNHDNYKNYNNFIGKLIQYSYK